MHSIRMQAKGSCKRRDIQVWLLRLVDLIFFDVIVVVFVVATAAAAVVSPHVPYLICSAIIEFKTTCTILNTRVKRKRKMSVAL